MTQRGVDDRRTSKADTLLALLNGEVERPDGHGRNASHRCHGSGGLPVCPRGMVDLEGSLAGDCRRSSTQYSSMKADRNWRHLRGNHRHTECGHMGPRHCEGEHQCTLATWSEQEVQPCDDVVRATSGVATPHGSTESSVRSTMINASSASSIPGIATSSTQSCTAPTGSGRGLSPRRWPGSCWWSRCSSSAWSDPRSARPGMREGDLHPSRNPYGVAAPSMQADSDHLSARSALPALTGLESTAIRRRRAGGSCTPPPSSDRRRSHGYEALR